jgi:hypothetical protein
MKRSNIEAGAFESGRWICGDWSWSCYDNPTDRRCRLKMSMKEKEIGARFLFQSRGVSTSPPISKSLAADSAGAF